MSRVIGSWSLALGLVAMLLMAAACNGNGGGSSSVTPSGDGDTEYSLPDNFPLYPGLELGDELILGGRWVVEASSDDPPEEIITFYEEALAKAPWETVSREELAQQTSIIFMGPDFDDVDGRVAVATESKNEEGATIVAIALPLKVAEKES